MRRREYQPTLKDYAYVFLLREAVRKADLFRDQKHCTVVLWLHPELSMDHAEIVLERVVLEDPRLTKRFSVAKVEKTKSGAADYSRAKTQLQEKTSLLVLLQSDENLPPFLIAAADQILHVGMISSRHLATASRAGNGIPVTTQQAEGLLRFPLDEMFAALRPGRSAEAALLKLAAAVKASEKPARPEVAKLGLKDLSGYGPAAQWGLVLAKDIADWRSGRIAWGDVDSGMLLSGPPGTGKTLFASALAKSCDSHFLATSLAQWQSRGHLGDLLKAMRADFATASEQAPCVLLVDEFDSIGDRSKFNNNNAQYCTEVVNGLLECIDGSNRLEGVVIVGACNDPTRIDSALLRSGRLASHFSIGLPIRDERFGILKTLLGGALRKPDIEEIAEATEGYTGADLARLVGVARRSARIRRRSLAYRDFHSAIPPATPLEGFHRRIVSVHEAGHAVVGVVLQIGVLNGIMVSSSYRPNGSTPIGLTSFARQTGPFKSRQYYLDEIAMLLGGMAAEEIVLGSPTSGSGGGQGTDLQQAADLATLMQVQYGMGDAPGHLRADTPDELDALRRSNPVIFGRVERLLTVQMERARTILIGNLAALEAIAAEACVERTVNGVKIGEFLASGR